MAQIQAGQPGQSFFKGRRLGQARVREIAIVDNFKLGYRNREDITNSPPGVLVVGSQNVLVNTSSRIQVRQGYTVDGAKSSVNAPIKSSFEWMNKGVGARYVRAGFLTSAGNDGKLQFRYDNGTTVTWTDLLTSLTTVNYNFTTQWDSTELLRLMLFVNGTNNIYEWNGAYDTVVSVTANTITMTNNIGTSGFYSSRSRTITINGTDYTYSGISGSTFTGVSGSPVGSVNAGDLAFQKVITTAGSSFTAGPATSYKIDLISTLNNQVFIGSLTSSTLYMSKIGSYVDYSFGTPRLPAEGATATLDDNIVGFIPQETDMYISAGRNFWYNTTLTQSSSFNGTTTIINEAFKVQLLKVNNQQGAQSQDLINKAGNKIIMVTFEPTFDELGRVENIIAAPNTVNMSDPIKLDFDTYDFTGGSVYSWKVYRIVSIPTLGIIRMYNEFTKAWEAPQTIPISSFYTVAGELYGHSSITSESYKLFDGYSDRATSTAKGSPYLAMVNFSYQNFGTRTSLKNQNEFYMEGYISANTEMDCVINYEQDANLTTQTFSVLGDDTTAIGSGDGSNSLGKNPLGEQPGGSQINTSLTGLPPKFRIIKTFPRADFYECQFSFSILGIDQNFQLLAFGTNAAPADATNSAIKE